MSDKAPNTDLSFATLDELFDELVRRTSAILVAFTLKSDGDSMSRCRIDGNRLLGQGLLMDLEELVRHRMARADAASDAEDDEGDDTEDKD